MHKLHERKTTKTKLAKGMKDFTMDMVRLEQDGDASEWDGKGLNTTTCKNKLITLHRLYMVKVKELKCNVYVLSFMGKSLHNNFVFSFHILRCFLSNPAIAVF